MLRIVASLLVLWIFLIAASVDKRASTPLSPTPPLMPIPESQAATNLNRRISELDRQLFKAVFDDCDLATLQSLLAPDFEFLHDKGGLVATNALQFVNRIRQTCEGRTLGKEMVSRRELLTTEVFPLANYGAIQTGTHRFHILEPGKPERAGDLAKFTHVWRKTSDGWQIARVLSYDHKAQEEAKPQ